MLELKTKKKFEKDLKLVFKRGKSKIKIVELIDLLINEKPLPLKCKPHKLSGDWDGLWECHIEPDWLLVYQIEGNELVLVRTGSHSDLF
ncbi:MAG TPA: type II toxin-antitoxin system mRNA interferase toxin, RelE/StbE family [Alphaproteobacteria bacterium]|nr:type II toxin-antitoxin system mRNA interferase toxin, RelE/StbE family [Alphaproteobacteria bacterium]